MFAAALMLIAALAEAFLGIDAEGRPLELAHSEAFAVETLEGYLDPVSGRVRVLITSQNRPQGYDARPIRHSVGRKVAGDRSLWKCCKLATPSKTDPRQIAARVAPRWRCHLQ
jgi:hypothetical protein